MSRRWLRAALIATVLLILGVVIPWSLDPEIHSMDAPNAAVFPGSYVPLSDGHTRYRLEGNGDAGTVLLIGGLTTSLEFFDGLTQHLTNEGYRTLRFDLFGRGGSARPAHLTYGQQTYVKQINDLFEALDIDEPVHVIGQSLGGGIAAAWAADHPERVRSLSLHASAGHLAALPSGSSAIRIPILGDYLWWWIGNGFVSGNVDNYFAAPAQQAAAITQLNAQFDAAERYHGYRRAVLATIRHFGAEAMSGVFSRLSAGALPIQLLWGREDQLIPVANARALADWMTGSPDLIVLDDVGHMPLLEAPDQVHQLVLDHLQKSQGG